MDRLLTPNQQTKLSDPEGSLINADMGAWYPWLNLRRLPEGERWSFLVWFENHGEAVAVGPHSWRALNPLTRSIWRNWSPVA
jgi:hypothetical protein